MRDHPVRSAYQGGGGVFLVVYIIVVALIGHPMVQMETAIGRYTGKDTVTAFQRISKKWGFAGWMANICTLMINMYYVVVGGWVAKYAFQYLTGGDFGADKQAYFDSFTSSTVEPIVWAMITDVIDDSEVKNGVREDGTIYSVYSFARKLGQAFSAGLIGALLSMIGYSTATQQDPAVLSGIYNIACLAPIIGFTVIALVLAFVYPLSKKVVDGNVETLKARRAGK